MQYIENIGWYIRKEQKHEPSSGRTRETLITANEITHDKREPNVSFTKGKNETGRQTKQELQNNEI